MSPFAAALWAESLKARRSRVPLLTAAGFSLAPVMGGVFMFILKEPARARSLGLLGAKAQLTAGTADWPTLLALFTQATAVGGSLLFALVTAWVFGREFVDGTAKEWLALPTPRWATVAAKFSVVAVWTAALTLMGGMETLLVGTAVGLPGWSTALLGGAARDLAIAAALTIALMPPVALAACAGRGYLPALGWAILTLFMAQILAATGWGAWFPWSVPALFGGLAGPGDAGLGWHSYAAVLATGALGLAGTFAWWRTADQAG